MQAARHRGHYGRAERVGTAAPALPDAEVSDAPRAHADGGAPTRTLWEQLLWCEPMLRGPSSIGRRQTRAGREEEDTGSLTHAWLSRPPPSSTTTPQPGAPHPQLSACA
ncbi:hypothetical protein EVAR_61571_1 [Eumeta japonica]|uniref:Uncharacterized protein n=1 Tax=Eumeta variegata TaxID=151549 RepID=A0A4C1YTQ4_EUMVA|nr:hypothetical protein EVAR_61571_1 [Eumeta japonica]